MLYVKILIKRFIRFRNMSNLMYNVLGLSFSWEYYVDYLGFWFDKFYYNVKSCL